MTAPRMSRLALAAALAMASAAQGADLLSIYRDAMVSDPVYQSARAQYQASIEALPQARAGYLPLVAFEASVFHNDIDRQIAADQHFTTQSYVVTLSQPVFRLQNWIAIDQAKQQVLQAEANLAAAQQDLATRVAQAYFDVLLAQDNVTLSQAQMNAISEQLAQAKRNFEVGTATIVDTLDAQARYDQTSALTIANQNDLEVKRRALTQLVGKLPDTLLPLKEPLKPVAPQPNDIEAWVHAADESSFPVAIAKSNLVVAEEEVKRQKAGHLPTLDLTANVGRGVNPQTAVPNVIGSTANTGTVGLQLAIPLYSGGLIQSRVRQALANRDRAQQDLENTQRTVAQTVRANFLNVTSGIAQVNALEQAVVSTQSQLDSTILGRDVGVRTSVDVLNAQQQVYQTRRDLQQARYNFLLNTLRLKSATGTLAEADMEKLNTTLGR